MGIPELHAEVLRLILQRFEDVSVEWVVTGSVGMALQGAPFEVHDIDIQTDGAGAYRLGSKLAEFAVTPVRYVTAERIRSHLGEFEIKGVTVEIMGGIEKLVGGRWEEPVDVRKDRCWATLGEFRVPVLSLGYEVEAYGKLGRSVEAARLRAWLEEQG